MKFYLRFALTFFTLLLMYSCGENISQQVKAINFSETSQASNASSISDALLKAAGEEMEIISSDTSDENGFFRLTGLPEDLTGIKLLIEHTGFLPKSFNLNEISESFKSSDNQILIIEDSCCGRLEIYFEKEDESPLEKVEARLNEKDKTLKTGKTILIGNFAGVNYYFFTHNLRGYYEVGTI